MAAMEVKMVAEVEDMAHPAVMAMCLTVAAGVDMVMPERPVLTVMVVAMEAAVAVAVATMVVMQAAAQQAATVVPASASSNTSSTKHNKEITS